MVTKRLSSRLLPLVAVLLVILLTGCVAQLGTTWAGLTVLDDGISIVYAYEDTLAIVNAVTGEPQNLLDEDGERLIDNNGEPIIWRIKGNDFENAKFFAAPIQLGDTLLVPTLDRRMLRIDLATAQAENADGVVVEGNGSIVTDPLMVNDLIYVGLQEQLIALDADSLSTAWTVPTDHAVWSQPNVIESDIYFVSLDHNLYAADATSGELKWKVELGGAAVGTPAYDPELDRLFVGTFDRTVLGISPEGEIVSSYTTDEWVWGAPVLADGMLYTADLKGVVYKLDPETLTEEDGWKAPIASGAIRTRPLVVDGFVIVGSRDEHVYWLNQDSGNVVFDRQLDGEILSDLLFFPANPEVGIEEDMVVVSTLSNREALVAFDAATGERIWTFRR